MLNRSGESRHLCPVLELRGNAFSALPLSLMFTIDFLYVAFIIRQFLCSSVFVCFCHEFCQMLLLHQLR